LASRKLCATGEVPENQLKAVDVDGVVILVTRVGDAFSAFPPQCPHMEEPLHLLGFCSGGTLTCTKHLWEWDLRDGSLQGLAERPLLLYPLERRGEELWIDFNGELVYNRDE
jgi:toluene monooxygenase system ferredoxin subunit